MKSQIIEQLGQSDILLPSLIAEGLAANDRVKVRISALQAAAQHAREPGQPVIELRHECHAAGVDASSIMSLIRGAHMTVEGRIAVPNLGNLTEGVLTDVSAMIRAVRAGAPTEGEGADTRLSALKSAATLGPENEIGVVEIAKLSGVSEDGADSLHRLVMDLHKTLNRLAAACAEEVVAGAHAFGLQPADRGAGLHARSRRDARLEVRSSGTRYDGHAFEVPAGHPE
jgi:hypothetical protein